MASPSYDLVLVGSSFASTFFLLEVLEHVGPDFRALVLEKGQRFSMPGKIPVGSNVSDLDSFRDVGAIHKPWITNTRFGGNSNCWWACTPRFLPEDFEMHSRYGVGVDWPLSYDDLEPYYCQAERIMSISGDPLDLLPRSEPFPQEPHVFNEPDRVLKARYPDRYTVQPCARARRRTAGRRPCCAVGTCDRCPRDAKFTVSNELSHLFDDPRVDLELSAEAVEVEVQGDRATGVRYRRNVRSEQVVRADFVALGANALFNPSLLLRSGLSSRWTGAGLHEQHARSVDLYLDGLENFQGSTSITGHAYMCYSREERADRASALVENWNTIRLRPERGRHREIMRLKYIYEDLPLETNRVTVAADGTTQVDYSGKSAYCDRGLASLEADLAPFLDALPVERVELDPQHHPSEAHVLGTTRMSRETSDGVVDGDLLHHRVRNLAVLGAGAFPTSSPSNPTLTLCALSLRSARRVFGQSAVA